MVVWSVPCTGLPRTFFRAVRLTTKQLAREIYWPRRHCHAEPSHLYAVAMESAYLAPKAQVNLYPWKDSATRTALAVRHVQTFLRANTPRAK
jgi:hypothetical protein